METLTRADGATIRIKVECWQHDPYTVYMPVSPKQLKRLEEFRLAAEPVEQEDGSTRETTSDCLRWGDYAARVVPIIASPGYCPHCNANRMERRE